MDQAYDFSFSLPTVAELDAAGARAVCVYVVGAGKAITKAALDVYLDAGFEAVCIVEYGANDVASGFNGGVANAQAGRAALAVLGLPAGTPLFMTADEDLPVPSTAIPYYQGASSVLTPAFTGDYDEGALMLDLVAQGLTTYHWLSESKGFPGYAQAVADGLPCMIQLYNASTVPGTDVNNILKADFGQYPPPAVPQEEDIMISNVFDYTFTPVATAAVPKPASMTLRTQAHVLPSGSLDYLYKVLYASTGWSHVNYGAPAEGVTFVGNPVIDGEAIDGVAPSLEITCGGSDGLLYKREFVNGAWDAAWVIK